jgi:anthranilate synthase component 2
MFLVIDNYDSFTYNLVHYLGELGATTKVVRNDTLSVAEVAALSPEGIVLSPGPATPNEAGICLEVVEKLGATTPIFGVCLGHQTIGQVYGGTVTRAPKQMHGKTSTIRHSAKGVFRGLNDGFTATRYHSLIVEAASFPPSLEAIAWSEDDLIMGLMHREHPVHGVQFHPESIASENGHRIIGNFLELAREFNRRHSRAA